MPTSEPIGLLQATRLPLIFNTFAQIVKWESYDVYDVRMSTAQENVVF